MGLFGVSVQPKVWFIGKVGSEG